MARLTVRLDEEAQGSEERPPALSPAIQTVQLVKRYRTTTALDGFTMTVPRGEIFGFLGPNGAGKTTAVKLLVGLTRPTSGEAWVLGQPAGDRATRKRIGYLPELFRYQDWLSAWEVLNLHCELAGVPRAERKAEIERALSLVGLTERAWDRVGTFSKGMQQRLGLGVSLLGNPELIFLDEPTSALDPVGRHDVREIIRALKAQGTTIFLNSHLLSEVEQVCDHVAIIHRGRTVAHGTLDELRGEATSVRLRLGPLTAEARSHMRGFGALGEEAGRYVVQGINPERVPELVADLVRLGVRVYSVDPSQWTLEDRFLQLLGGDAHADLDDRAPDPA